MKHTQIIKSRPGYTYIHIPRDKYSFFWKPDIVDYEQANDGGWIFWMVDPTTKVQPK